MLHSRAPSAIPYALGWGGGGGGNGNRPPSERRKRRDVTSAVRWLRLIAGPRDKMADLSLDELIRKRGVTVKGR